MRKAARGAAAEHQADGRALRNRLGWHVAPNGLIAVLSATSQKMKHGTVLSRNISRVARKRKCFTPTW